MARKMERGYLYHANFIYNQPKFKIARHRNKDHNTSLNVVKFIVQHMETWGFKDTYYHDRDALPGGNIFDEFFTSVKKSRYTIVIVTKGFINDCWGRYKSQASFCKLLDRNKLSRFIAIYIDLDEKDVPEEMNVMVNLAFGEEWQNEMEEWMKLKTILLQEQRPITDTGPDPFPITMENSAGQTTSSNRTQNTCPERNIFLPSGGNYQGSVQVQQMDVQGTQYLRGLQDTNPPPVSALRRNISLDTDAVPQVQNDSGQSPREDDPRSLGFSLANEQNSNENQINSNNSAAVDNPGTVAVTTQMAPLCASTAQSNTSIRKPPDGGHLDSSQRMAPEGQNISDESAFQHQIHVMQQQSTESVTSDTSPKDIANDQDDYEIVESSLNQSDIEIDNQNSESLVQNNPAERQSKSYSESTIKTGKTEPFSLGKYDATTQLQQIKLKSPYDAENFQSEADGGHTPRLDLKSLNQSEGNAVNIQQPIGIIRPSTTISADSKESCGSLGRHQGSGSLYKTAISLVPDKHTLVYAASVMAKPLVNILTKCDQSFM